MQRVSEAAVRVDGELIGGIGPGVLVLLAVQAGDNAMTAEKMAEKVLNFRLFADAKGRMNLSLRDTGGGLLMVPQFTLAADTQAGLRPSFSRAAPPAEAEQIFLLLCEKCRSLCPGPFAMGRFGADMQVALINDGPVTFWLEI